MNKQELIEAVIELPVDCSGSRPKIDQLTTLELTKLLDEPKKIEIPQEVADYIEFKKKNNFHVYGAMRVIEDHYDKRVPEWFYEGNIEKFCLAWIFGYEVEEEKRYLVGIKGVSDNSFRLKYHPDTKRWIMGSNVNNSGLIAYHTRKELEEANFGWVFSCEGIEIEEVE